MLPNFLAAKEFELGAKRFRIEDLTWEKAMAIKVLL